MEFDYLGSSQPMLSKKWKTGLDSDYINPSSFICNLIFYLNFVRSRDGIFGVKLGEGPCTGSTSTLSTTYR